MPQPLSAPALLIFAALLAGFLEAVRALSAADRRPRPVLLAAGAVAGVAASAIGLAPVALGTSFISTDLSAAALLLGSVLVAGVDLVEVGRGVWLSYSERRRSSDLDSRLAQVEALVAAGDLRGAAVALHEALVAVRSLDNPPLAWSTLLRAAVIDADLDRLAMARRHLGEAATIAQERLSTQHLANVFAELSWVAYLGADPELAGTCLAWAGRAAGRIEPRGPFAATTTLLAGYLSLSAGELESAESAFALVPTMEFTDDDLVAGLELGRVLLHYLQGWNDSARDELKRALPNLLKAHWRSRLALPLISLTIQARASGRDEDVRAAGQTAADLSVKGGTMAALALYCADPANDIAASSRAAGLGRLLSAAREPATR